MEQRGKQPRILLKKRNLPPEDIQMVFWKVQVQGLRSVLDDAVEKKILKQTVGGAGNIQILHNDFRCV